MDLFSASSKQSLFHQGTCFVQAGDATYSAFADLRLTMEYRLDVFVVKSPFVSCWLGSQEQGPNLVGQQKSPKFGSELHLVLHYSSTAVRRPVG